MEAPSIPFFMRNDDSDFEEDPDRDQDWDSDIDDSDDDEVVEELDVFLNTGKQEDDLLVVQFPLRPCYRVENNPSRVRVRPKHGVLELAYDMDKDWQHYDPDQQDDRKLHRRIYQSSVAASSHATYCVGVLRASDDGSGEREFHLTPIKEILNMRPDVGHVHGMTNDLQVDPSATVTAAAAAAAAQLEFEAAEDERIRLEEEAAQKGMKVQAVEVVNQRKETERMQSMRRKSFAHLKMYEYDDDWVNLRVSADEEGFDQGATFQRLLYNAEDGGDTSNSDNDDGMSVDSNSSVDEQEGEEGDNKEAVQAQLARRKARSAKAKAVGLAREARKEERKNRPAPAVFGMMPKDYLEALTPESESLTFAARTGQLAVMTDAPTVNLNTPLQSQVLVILNHYKVVAIKQIAKLTAQEPVTLLPSLQTYAMLVRGLWVLKSEELYSDSGTNHASTVAAQERRIAVRDIVLARLNRSSDSRISRADCSDFRVSPNLLKEALDSVAKQRTVRDWELNGHFDRQAMHEYRKLQKDHSEEWLLREKRALSSFVTLTSSVNRPSVTFAAGTHGGGSRAASSASASASSSAAASTADASAALLALGGGKHLSDSIAKWKAHGVNNPSVPKLTRTEMHAVLKSVYNQDGVNKLKVAEARDQLQELFDKEPNAIFDLCS